MNILRISKKVICLFITFVARLIPLQNIVILNSFKGKGMADDPKYIALELLRRKVNVKLIWLLNDIEHSNIPEGILPVKLGSYKACYYLSIARVWIDNCRGLSSWVLKRPGQYYIQTWHATLGIKKLGEDNNKSSNAARNHVRKDMGKVDLMYANSDFRVDKYKHTFWYDGPVIKCDQPRVSFIMHQPKGLKKRICLQLGISEECKIAMYAPTFRDDNPNEIDAYLFDFNKIRQRLEDKFGADFVFLLRLHPNLRNNPVVQKLPFSDKVVNATQLPDMEELLCVTDVLFTDFSSSMFDCSIGGKIVFLVAKDYEHYITVNRELYFNPKTELPFEFCESEDELLSAIKQFDAGLYQKKCEEFYKRIGLEDHGNGDKVLADIVISRMK